MRASYAYVCVAALTRGRTCIARMSTIGVENTNERQMYQPDIPGDNAAERFLAPFASRLSALSAQPAPHQATLGG
eukprot:COSAG03_NODE_666_length_6376_cov_2.241995_3_plen_75_part_00